MDTYEAILKRRSVRSFTDAPVSDEAVMRLLESAMAAPSACNACPWEFYVVREGALQDKLRRATKFSDLNSTLIIVVAGNQRKALSRRDNDFWIQDCSAAIENMLLAATDMGLGSCWCGLLPLVSRVKKVRTILSAPEHIVPLSLLHFGHPAEFPEPRTQYDEQKIHYL